MSTAKKTTPVVLVSDFMVNTVIRVTPAMTLHEVAELFITYQISGAPIVDTNDQVLTVIGEGDTLRLAAQFGLDTKVAHCLSQLPKTEALTSLKPQDTFQDAYRLFLKHKVHRFPVITSNGQLKGLVTRSTILTLFVEAHYGKKIRKKLI